MESKRHDKSFFPHLQPYAGTEPGLGVRGGRSINKKKFEIPNKHSFNKPSTKKNTQNYFFFKILQCSYL